MSTYLVDYENVSLNGLEGIEKLSDKEKVFIFYGNSAGSISFEMHAKIAQTRAEVKYLKTERSGKNYLDFQLATLSGYLVATTQETDFIIVSKDTGFESVIDFWNQQSVAENQVKFSRRERIDGLVQPRPAAQPAQPVRPAAQPVRPVAQPAQSVRPAAQPARPAAQVAAQPQQTATQSRPAPRPKYTRNLKQPRPTAVTEGFDKMLKDPVAVPERPVQKPRKVLPKLEERYKKEIRELVREECHSPKDYSMIYKIVVRTTSIEMFYSQMLAGFKKDRGTRLYEIVLPVYTRILKEKGINQ